MGQLPHARIVRGPASSTTGLEDPEKVTVAFLVA